jgi:hypothetical protein
VIVTWSALGGQDPLEIVHLRTADASEKSPVTPEVGEDGLVMLANPLTTVHNPVPINGVFPARVVEAWLHSCWSGPALDIVGSAETVMVTWSILGGQVPLEMVQASVALDPTRRPVTPDVGE